MDKSQQTLTDIFGPVISSYSRAQAIEDGILIDVSEMAREAGFKPPVALTSAAWEDCVAWNADDNKRQTYQDESGRLWDVLFMLHFAIQCSRNNNSTLLYKLRRVPRGGRGHLARDVTLKSIIGSGDTSDPVITIMLPHED
jgi:hypothetical protein